MSERKDERNKERNRKAQRAAQREKKIRAVRRHLSQAIELCLRLRMKPAADQIEDLLDWFRSLTRAD